LDTNGKEKKSILDTKISCYRTVMTLPNRIRFWRQQKGWTLQQLAEAADTTRAQIDKLEHGTRRLTVDWMVRLATPLGCDPRSLMALSGLAETAQLPLAPPPLPFFTLRLRQNRAYRTISKAKNPFLAPQRYGADAYAIMVPSAWQQQLRGPARYALIQPRAPLRCGGLILLAQPDETWQCGWLLEKGKQSMRWQPLGGQPQKFLRESYSALHPITALCDGA